MLMRDHRTKALSVGDTLPELATTLTTNRGQTLRELSHDQRLLVVLLRHTACPFCQEAIDDLKRARPELEEQGTVPVLVHQATESEFIASMFEKAGVADVPRIGDPQEILYDMFDVRKGNLWQLCGPQVIWGVVRVMLKGLRPAPKMVGSFSRLNGAVVIENNTLVARHRYRSQADRADLPGLCALQQ